MRNALSLFLFLISSVANGAASVNPQEILQKSDLRRGLQGSFSMYVRTQSQDGSDKIEHGYFVNVQNEKNSLVEQVEPPRAKGRKLLMKDLDMWLFTPDVKKPIRVSLQQKLTGEISNGDISRTNYAQDYVAKLAGIDKKSSAYILNLKAKDKKVTYDNVKYWIQQKNYRPIRAEFYALSGKLLKVATFSKFKKIKGVDRMTHVTIVDAVNPTKKSIMTYSRHKIEEFPDSLFNKEQMDR